MVAESAEGARAAVGRVEPSTLAEDRGKLGDAFAEDKPLVDGLRGTPAISGWPSRSLTR